MINSPVFPVLPQFFDFIVLPLFATVAEVLPSIQPLLAQVRRNYDMWREAEAKARREASSSGV